MNRKQFISKSSIGALFLATFPFFGKSENSLTYPRVNETKEGYEFLASEADIPLKVSFTNMGLGNNTNYDGDYFAIKTEKGMFKYGGELTKERVDSLKKAWIDQPSSFNNFHKRPFINSDKLIYIYSNISKEELERINDYLSRVNISLEYTYHSVRIGNAEKKLLSLHLEDYNGDIVHTYMIPENKYQSINEF